MTDSRERRNMREAVATLCGAYIGLLERVKDAPGLEAPEPFAAAMGSNNPWADTLVEMMTAGWPTVVRVGSYDGEPSYHLMGTGGECGTIMYDVPAEWIVLWWRATRAAIKAADEGRAALDKGAYTTLGALREEIG